MIIASETRLTAATASQIWAVWNDVERWNVWDQQVEYSRLDSPMRNGSVGELKPQGGPKTRFTISDCVENRSFTSTSKLPFCRMLFIHTLEDKGNKREVSHRIEMFGPLSFLFAKILGPSIKKGLPEALNNLVFTAENH